MRLGIEASMPDITREQFDEVVIKVQDSVWKTWPYQSITTGINFVELVSKELFGPREERSGLS